MTSRGCIVLVEGLDRTGKSTQADLIVKQFKVAGKQAEIVKFPDRTTAIGKIINEFLVNKSFELPKESIHLLFSANRWELKKSIEDKLAKGVNLVMDRYYYSGIAYSTANGLDFNWCKMPDIGLPKPDLTLFLTFKDPSNVVKLSGRANYGDERYEIPEFQQRVRTQFERLFENAREDEFKTVYVDNKSIEQVENDIKQLVAPFIDGVFKKISFFS